ncbi:hypothetical protein V6Z11_D04G155400 [Gossypium hirsutum]
MAKKKAFTPLLYLASIVFLPCWELMIGSIYKDFGFAHNDEIISGLVSTFPVILDTIFKYWIFRYLNRESPSLVVIYHSMND